MKRIRSSVLTIGEQVGIISFNETVFKELLDIAVISTDFEKMGQSVASVILNNEEIYLRNPFKMIIRNSL